MFRNIFKSRVFVILTFVSLSFCIYLLIDYLKDKEIQQYKIETYREKVIESKVYLNTLIKEKQNTTSTIGLGLSRNSDIIDALKNTKINPKLLEEYSKRLKHNTDFKNVWFQLITKDGISVQRSWTDYKNDKISVARTDLQQVMKEKKLLNTISVGKFDMTFKVIVPVFVLDLIFSEGSKVLTDGQSAVPKRLLDAGFGFQFQNIEDTIENLV